MTNQQNAPDSHDEAIYAAALSEIQSGSVRPGVWAKALADSEGDENKCKALYIRLRVQHEKENTRKASSPHRAMPSEPYPVDGTAASLFIDPTKLTQWLKLFLFVSIVIDAIALFSGVSQYQLLSDFKFGIYSSEALATTLAESNDKRQQVIGWFQVGVAITTVILFVMWIYRANLNVRQLGAKNMKFTPEWSVGYYFIPFLNLWRPYQAMKEIWQASKNPTTWESVERGAILPWWWLFFIVASLLGNASFRSSLDANKISELLTATGVTIASDVVSIPATIIALILVKQIYDMQMSHVP